MSIIYHSPAVFIDSCLPLYYANCWRDLPDGWGPEQALSALVQGRACGLLATSSDLELGLLQSCFQLDDYEHLVKVKINDKYKKHQNTPECAVTVCAYRSVVVCIADYSLCGCGGWRLFAPPLLLRLLVL